MASLREAQKQMTRRLMLDAGLELFISKGYAATTIDDIATAAGTTRVTFYAYFSSRSVLMKALIDERLNEQLQREVGSPERGSTADNLVSTVVEGTYEAVRAWLAERADNWPTIHPLIKIGREAAVIDPELANLVEQWIEEAITDIEVGLTKADRFEPHQRRFRGVLAMAQLDYVAQNWASSEWKIEREEMLSELATSWTSLLT